MGWRVDELGRLPHCLLDEVALIPEADADATAIDHIVFSRLFFGLLTLVRLQGLFRGRLGTYGGPRFVDAWYIHWEFLLLVLPFSFVRLTGVF